MYWQAFLVFIFVFLKPAFLFWDLSCHSLQCLFLLLVVVVVNFLRFYLPVAACYSHLFLKYYYKYYWQHNCLFQKNRIIAHIKSRSEILEHRLGLSCCLKHLVNVLEWGRGFVVFIKMLICRGKANIVYLNKGFNIWEIKCSKARFKKIRTNVRK